jgi:hypothetical protein
MPEHVVALQSLDHATKRCLERLAEVLADGAVGAPDEVGIVEVRVEARDFEGALHVVWNAIAAAGADDHLAFAEHPDIPLHWRRRPDGA